MVQDKTNNLQLFLKDLADTIRANSGETAVINAQNFASNILLEERQVNAPIGSDLVVTPTSGIYGIKKLTIKNIASGSASINNDNILSNIDISVDSNGLITATHNSSKEVGATVNAGYIENVNSGLITTSGSGTKQLDTLGEAIITPSEEEQPIVKSGEHRYTTGEIKVKAIPNTYIGSAISKYSQTETVKNPTFSGATASYTYTIPAGYYDGSTSIKGSATMGSASYGTVTTTNPSVTSKATITPGTSKQYLKISAGYTATGMITVNAIPSNYTIPSGTKNITENGTYEVKSYASVSVDVASGGSVIVNGNKHNDYY